MFQATAYSYRTSLIIGGVKQLPRLRRLRNGAIFLMAQPPLLRKAVLSKMFRARDLPSWGRRGNEPRNEASGVVLKKRERSEPPYIFA